MILVSIDYHGWESNTCGGTAIQQGSDRGGGAPLWSRRFFTPDALISRNNLQKFKWINSGDFGGDSTSTKVKAVWPEATPILPLLGGFYKSLGRFFRRANKKFGAFCLELGDWKLWSHWLRESPEFTDWQTSTTLRTKIVVDSTKQPLSLWWSIADAELQR